MVRYYARFQRLDAPPGVWPFREHFWLSIQGEKSPWIRRQLFIDKLPETTKVVDQWVERTKGATKRTKRFKV